MAYKYFLGLSPEEKMVNPSLLSKFRETRITEDILEDLLKETICQAIEKGLVKSGTIIVEATVRAKSMPQVLRELTKGLRRRLQLQQGRAYAPMPGGTSGNAGR